MVRFDCLPLQLLDILCFRIANVEITSLNNLHRLLTYIDVTDVQLLRSALADVGVLSLYLLYYVLNARHNSLVVGKCTVCSKTMDGGCRGN